jgi:hypothetical protein
VVHEGEGGVESEAEGGGGPGDSPIGLEEA